MKGQTARVLMDSLSFSQAFDRHMQYGIICEILDVPFDLWTSLAEELAIPRRLVKELGLFRLYSRRAP